MHIPDGFLDAKTAVAAGALAAGGLGAALRRVRITLPRRRVPLMGLAAAFVFAAQMLNFPVMGGTSGHLIGAVLTAVLLGPSAAVLVISAVLILQCLMFADGGVTALGANIFNMGLVAAGIGYAVYLPMRKMAGGLRGCLFAAGCAAWCSTVAASVACAGQLALSGVVSWRVALPAMAGVHIFIGLGEAVITMLVLAGIARVRPELILNEQGASSAEHFTDLATYGLMVCAGLVVFVAPVACGWPDGLEKVADTLGFGRQSTTLVRAPLPDYAVPGLSSHLLSTVTAGCAGVMIAFLLTYILARGLAPKSVSPAPGQR
jgi:cobalt/nickel transport system permease protein